MLGSFKQFSLAFFTAAVGNVYSLIRVIQYELIFNTSVKNICNEETCSLRLAIKKTVALVQVVRDINVVIL